MHFILSSLLSFCLISYEGHANPFATMKDKALLIAGGLMQKKENDEFIKYRNHPIYSAFFDYPITNAQGFKDIFDKYNAQVNNWNARTVYTLNEQVPNLHARVEDLRLFARTYNLLEYMRKLNIYDSSASKTRIDAFLKQCRVKSTAIAEREIKEGKPFEASTYLFLSASCSKESHSILTSEKKSIATFLSYALTNQSQDSFQNKEVKKLEQQITTTNNSPLSALKQKCINSPVPECSGLVRNVYYNIIQHPLTLMLYGNGRPLTPIRMDDTTTHLFKTCSNPASFSDQRCKQFSQKLAQTWQKIDPAEELELSPNPQAYLISNEILLDKTFSESDFKAQAAFDNYTGYKDIEDIFNQIYAMACALNITYRMRLSPSENASFVEQQIALSDSKAAQSARNAISGVSGKIQSFAESNNKIASKFGKIGSDLLSKNASLSVVENEDIYLAPNFIHYYIRNWINLHSKDIEVSPNKTANFEDLIKGLNPVSKKTIKDNNIVIEIDYDNLFGVLSKICISILGPEYLKAETDISKALQEEDERMFENSIKDVTIQLKSNSSKKDSRAFRYLPSNEYNKLRQIALIMLTNIHVILLDDRLKRQSKKSPFHIVAMQLKQGLEKQLAFFARYIYALSLEKYEANSLSMSPFNMSFTETFIKCIYPISENDLSTLVDADGTNMYSLYTSYLVGSIYGLVDDNNEKNISLDNRSIKNKFIGDFKKAFGMEAELSLQAALKGGIKTGLQTLTPIPPVLTGIIASGATVALMAGPKQIYKIMRGTCRFNKDKCIAMNLKNVDLTRPLDTRITEFLTAFGYSLENQIEKYTTASKTQKFSPIMPTLFVLENEETHLANILQEEHLTNLDDIFQALFERTKNYYASLNFQNISQIPNMSKRPNTPIDLSDNDDTLEKSSMTPPLNVFINNKLTNPSSVYG